MLIICLRYANTALIVLLGEPYANIFVNILAYRFASAFPAFASIPNPTLKRTSNTPHHGTRLSTPRRRTASCHRCRVRAVYSCRDRCNSAQRRLSDLWDNYVKDVLKWKSTESTGSAPVPPVPDADAAQLDERLREVKKLKGFSLDACLQWAKTERPVG